jgi:hypothetical protein
VANNVEIHSIDDVSELGVRSVDPKSAAYNFSGKGTPNLKSIYFIDCLPVSKSIISINIKNPQ